MNCFSKAGISKDQQRATVNDDNDPFKALAEEFKSVRAQKTRSSMKISLK